MILVLLFIAVAAEKQFENKITHTIHTHRHSLRSITLTLLTSIRKYLELDSKAIAFLLLLFFFVAGALSDRSYNIIDFIISAAMWLYLLLIFTSMHRSTTCAHARGRFMNRSMDGR